MFADSGLTAGLQIADIVSALIYTNAYREKVAPAGADPSCGYVDYTHTKRYYKPFKDIIFESKNRYGAPGNRMYGLRTIDHRDWPVPAKNLIALQKKFSA